jgi:hypothetical protein
VGVSFIHLTIPRAGGFFLLPVFLCRLHSIRIMQYGKQKTAGAYTELIGIGPELVQTQLAIFNLAL